METTVDFDGDLVHFAATLGRDLLALGGGGDHLAFIIFLLHDHKVDQFHVAQHLETVANDLPVGSVVMARYGPIALVGPKDRPQRLYSRPLCPDVQVPCDRCCPGEEPVRVVRGEDFVRSRLHEVGPLPLKGPPTWGILKRPVFSRCVANSATNISAGTSCTVTAYR